MKQYTIGTFPSRSRAEEAVNRLHNELDVDNDEISYIYKNTEGEIKEVEADEVSTDTPAEGAKKGAAVGGTIGAIAGLATVAGMIPVIGPIFAAGPIVSALGLGAGALGTTAAGALTGAAAGSLIGALTNMGVGKEKAQEYEDSVMSGNVLVAAHADEDADVAALFRDCGASDVEVYALA